MNREEFIKALELMDLPREDFVILSGGSLLMRGLREQTSDLDISVSQRLAEKLDLYNCPKDKHGLYMPFENVQMMDDMEKFQFDVIDGYQCESPADILRQKRQWNRPKDRIDIENIKAYQYKILAEQGKSLVEGVPYMIANLANLSALIFQTLDCINWAGFYLTQDTAQDKTLVLGPFQGKPACIVIPFGKGVCGTAAKEKHTVLVEDVHQFPGHIACDSASRSEIVVPMLKENRLIGVLDIDSPITARFTQTDKEGLEALIREIGYEPS